MVTSGDGAWSHEGWQYKVKGGADVGEAVSEELVNRGVPRPA